jgi:hypothetical protein
MKEYLANLLVYACKEEGLKLYGSPYSGKGMYGKKTTAVTGKHSIFLLAVFRVTKLVAQLDRIEDSETGEWRDRDDVLDDIETLVETYKEDALGMSLIFY